MPRKPDPSARKRDREGRLLLAPSELVAVAKILAGNLGNPFAIVREAYGFWPATELYAELDAAAGVVRCLECEVWKWKGEFADPGICRDCYPKPDRRR